MEQVAKPANPGTLLVTDRHGVTDDEPDDAQHAGQGKAVHQDAENVAFVNQAAVEEGQARDGHKQDQGG